MIDKDVVAEIEEQLSKSLVVIPIGNLNIDEFCNVLSKVREKVSKVSLLGENDT